MIVRPLWGEKGKSSAKDKIDVVKILETHCLRRSLNVSFEENLEKYLTLLLLV